MKATGQKQEDPEHWAVLLMLHTLETIQDAAHQPTSTARLPSNIYVAHITHPNISPQPAPHAGRNARSRYSAGPSPRCSWRISPQRPTNTTSLPTQGSARPWQTLPPMASVGYLEAGVARWRGGCCFRVQSSIIRWDRFDIMRYNMIYMCDDEIVLVLSVGS